MHRIVGSVAVNLWPRAVSSSRVSEAGTGGTVQGGTAQAGGWGQGGFLMMLDPAAGAVSWPATR
jgi:hypothetical protein